MDPIIGVIGFIFRLPITIVTVLLLLIWSLLVLVFVLVLWVVLVPVCWILFIPFRFLAVPMRGGTQMLKKQLDRNVKGWQGRMSGFFGYLSRLWSGLLNWQTGRRWRTSPQ